MIGQYELDVFGEAARSPEGVLTVDFLSGHCVEGMASASLARAIGLHQVTLATRQSCFPSRNEVLLRCNPGEYLARGAVPFPCSPWTHYFLRLLWS